MDVPIRKIYWYIHVLSLHWSGDVVEKDNRNFIALVAVHPDPFKTKHTQTLLYFQQL